MLRSSHRIRSVRNSALWAIVLSALVGSAAACLVTNEVDYDRPNTPARLTSLTERALRSVPTQPDCSDRDNGDTTRWLRFAVSIDDPDLEDALVARVLINGISVSTGGAGEVMSNGQRKEFVYCATKRQIYYKACVHVEILMSREFSDMMARDDPYKTKDKRDLGYADWWLVGPTENFPEVGVTACQKLDQSGL